jgi:FkbM family methyltransferase
MLGHRRGATGAFGEIMKKAFFAVATASAVFLGCHGEGAPPDILTNGKKLYSQYNEELIIRHFFDDKRGGTFLDVGCWDWKEGSTTLYLEDHLGWSGIAIDAQEVLRKGYEEHRPHTKFFSYAVGDTSGQKVKFYLAGQLSSTHDDHLKLFEGAKDFKPKEVEVETITLNDLLAREGVSHFDFMSMDIEEAEPAALAGFDIDKYKPALVGIEAAKPVREAITKYFTEHNYERIDEYLKYDDVNWWYRPKRG